jgi:hypothetical protein
MTQEFVPVILRFRRVHAQVLLEGLNGSLRLAISLLVVGGGHVEAGAKTLEKACPKHACESTIAVRDNGSWETIMLEDILEEYLGEFGGRAGGLAWDEDGGLAEAIDKNGDGVVTGLGLGKVCDKVHGDMRPRDFWNRKWL